MTMNMDLLHQSGERSDDIFVDYVVDLIREIKAIGDGSLRTLRCA